METAVLVDSVSTLAFRNIEDAETALTAGLTVLHGRNGAGKTNLLEALYFSLTGRSCRTRTEREMIAFGAPLARASATLGSERSGGQRMTMISSVSRAEGRARRVDGRPTRPEDDLRRPAISVFMPDRLALIKGPPAGRRAHLDRVIAALWPSRAEARRVYRHALAQRNAMLGRVRAGAPLDSLDAWDRALAVAAIPLIEARVEGAAALAEPFAEAALQLGLDGGAELAYRPRVRTADPDAICAQLHDRRDSDLGRGFSGFGPHLDEIAIEREGRALRRYGSQGQQRLGLLALLFAERALLHAARRQPPLLLLDDVMSELDPLRRERLVEALEQGGQALVTVTEPTHAPLQGRSARLIEIDSGRVVAVANQ